MSKPKRKATRVKPKKPYPDFPLTSNGNGQWSKKIHGKVYYFGPWADPQAARDRFLRERDYLYAGQTPPGECKTLADVLNEFMDVKEKRLKANELAQRTFDEYQAVCDTVAETLGRHRAYEKITRPDLENLRLVLSKGKQGQAVSPITHKRLLTFARMIFHFAHEELGLTIRYKKALSPPDARRIRQARAEAGERMYAAKEIQKLRKAAKGELRAMILLGINCAFGPRDITTLRTDGLDLAGGWHSHGRPKTGVPRRCPLWPETVNALRDVLKGRGAEGERAAFRHVWNRHTIARDFKTLTKACKVRNHGFYSLRRTFETIGSNSGVSQAAIDHIMGHAPRGGDMSAVYRQRIFDESLQKCADYVRAWMLGKVRVS